MGGMLRSTNIWERDLIFVGLLVYNKGDCSAHLSYLATFYQSGDLIFLPTLDRCCVCQETVKVVETVPILVDIFEIPKKSDVHLNIPTIARTGIHVT